MIRRPPRVQPSTPNTRTRAEAGAEAREERIFTAPYVNLMVANGLLRICTFMLTTLVPLYVIQSGGSPLQAGLTTTFYMFAAVLIRPAAGRLVDSRGRFAVLVAGAALYCTATGMFVPGLAVWTVLLVRAIQGFGFSLNGTAVMTLATDVIPESRMAEGIGYLGAEQTVAQVLGPWLALEIKNTAGYTVAFGVAFAFALVNLLVRVPLGAFARRRDRERLVVAASVRDSRPATQPPMWQRLVERDAWRPSVIIFCVTFGTAGVGTFLAVYATSQGISNAGPFYIASGLMVAVARLVLGRLLRRFPPVWSIAPGIGFVALSIAGIFFAHGLPLLIAAGACFGLGMGLVQPSVSALAVLVAAPERRGHANATFFMAMDLSQAIAAVLLGAAASVLGIGSVFIVGVIVLLSTLGGYFLLHGRGFLP